jgi:hypothetical protein
MQEETFGLGEAVTPEIGAGLGGSGTAPIRFGIWTWGSCRRSFVEMVYPRKLDFTWVTNRTGTVRTEWFVIDVINEDSRKNLHRKFTFVDVFQPIIIYHHGAYSCSKPFRAVYLVEKGREGIVLRELPIQHEVVTESINRYQILYEVGYVVYGGEKIVVKKIEISKKKVVYFIKVKVEADKIIVSGDTYEVRDTLKRLGFKWNPNDKTWVAPASVGVDFVRAELESIPEVIIVEGGEKGQQVEGNGDQ